MQKTHFTLIAATVFCLGSLISASAMSQEPVIVELDTTEGKIVLELDAAKAPLTVANFLKYVENGHYAGTIFHRVMADFMIQGGGMDVEMNEKETLPPVKNESSNGLKNDEYTVAMARTGAPHSATSQFFINSGNKNAFLNRSEAADGYGYAVFGKVIEGKEVVDAIEAKPTRSIPFPPKSPVTLMKDVPAESVTIKSVKVLSGTPK